VLGGGGAHLPSSEPMRGEARRLPGDEPSRSESPTGLLPSSQPTGCEVPGGDWPRGPRGRAAMWPPLGREEG
jgi:hypothetical protein